MRALILGANGFIGSAVAKEFVARGHEVIVGDAVTDAELDLLNAEQVEKCITDANPDVIINCAGVVGADANFEDNVTITKNVLEAVVRTGLKPKNIVVTGSAGEYGTVDQLPVQETAPLSGASPYALSKIKEEQTALSIAAENGLKVTVFRVFNPIGTNMHPRFLVMGLLRQLNALNEGSADHIEISRLDAKRDYLDVRDIATAYGLICEGAPKENVYNLGSGRAVTNGELLELLLKSSKMDEMPKVVETAPEPEPQIASQADVSRIQNEFGWQVTKSLESVVEEIVHAER